MKRFYSNYSDNSGDEDSSLGSTESQISESSSSTEDSIFSNSMLTDESSIKSECHRNFRYAAQCGDLNSLIQLKKQAPDELVAMIKSADYGAYRFAAKNGYLHILKWLKNEVPSELEAMIKSGNYYSFAYGADGGHLDILKWLKKQASSKLLAAMIRENDYGCFLFAARAGHLPILKWLKKQAPDELGAMIQALSYSPFRAAAEWGCLDILKWLKKQAPSEVEDMIEPYKYIAFGLAVERGKLETVNWLLLLPKCFAHAEQHDHEFRGYVVPFIDKTLSSLHQEYEAFSLQNPNEIFDIEEAKRAQLCFYLLRNLIRRNDRDFDDELRFLLTIPSVKGLAHQEITEGHSNELLRLAMFSGNGVAATLLLNIDAVRQLAEESNFYREEARDGINLSTNYQKQHQSAKSPGRNQASMFKKEKTVNTDWEMSGCEMISWAFFPVVGWFYLLYYAAYHTCCSTAPERINHYVS